MGWCKICKNHNERFRRYWASPSEEEEEEETKKSHLAVWWLSDLMLLRYFIAPLGILLVMKTLEDEWYIVTEACKFYRFWDFKKIFCIIIYCVSELPLHTESTDSMIFCTFLYRQQPQYGPHSVISQTLQAEIPGIVPGLTYQFKVTTVNMSIDTIKSAY